MNLELDILNIKDIRFGDKTSVKDAVLFINRDELQTLVAEDQGFSRVNIELAHPGENLRVVNVHNVVEPRAKMDGTGENFPGVLGQIEPAGNGRTRVLRGAGIVTIDRLSGIRGTVIDMIGPGSQASPFGSLNHVVLDCHPVDGIGWVDLQYALTIAGAKTAVYLAEASFGKNADVVEHYDLGTLEQAAKVAEHLPRIAYIYQIHHMQLSASPKAPVLYGEPVSKLLPTLVHPNEILDGAIVQGLWNWCASTYFIQNHPLVTELYGRHGKDLCFAGVVVMVATADTPDNKRNAMMAAKLAKTILGAEGVILTKIGGGAPNIDLGLTTEACERMGMRTTVVCQDTSVDGTSDSALLFNTPGALAIVNVGPHDTPFTLPPIERAIGGETVDDMPSTGQITVVGYRVADALSVLGGWKIKSQQV
jgi:sarcosine reductase